MKPAQTPAQINYTMAYYSKFRTLSSLASRITRCHTMYSEEQGGHSCHGGVSRRKCRLATPAVHGYGPNFIGSCRVFLPSKLIFPYVVSALQLCLYVSSFIWLIRSLQEILRNLAHYRWRSSALKFSFGGIYKRVGISRVKV